MGRILKGVVWKSARATQLMVTLALIAGLLVPISGGALAAVDGKPGTTLDPFTQTELDDNWEADRYFPTAGVTSVSAFGRDDVARIGIDTTQTQAGTFQRTEGIKTVGTGFFGRSVQVDLYLDPDWADKAVRAGVWVVGDDGTGARDNWFGIIEFLNMEPCPESDCTNPTNIPPSAFEGFRVYDSNTGWSEYLTTPFTYGEWMTLEITLDAAAEQYVYTIDGVEVATAAGGSHFISEVFLNSYNFGLDSFPTLLSEDYAAHWHVGSESDIVWTTEKVYPGDMNDWGFGFDSGADGSGAMVWGPGLPPVGGGSAFFELGDAATGYVIGTQAHGAPGTPFMDITALEYSTYRSAGDPAEAVALQFNVDYDLTDTTTSWQGRLVYEPYYTQTVLDDTWQTWDTLATGANWWSTGTPQVGNAADTKHCTMGAPCTWEEVLSYYPDAGIHELPLAGILLKAGSAWAGFEGNADELKIATGTTGTIFDFDPYAGGNCVVDASGGGDFLLLEPAVDAEACATIEVRAGEYVEAGQVVIDRDVTIIGDDRATTIFKTDSDTASSGDARGWFLVSSGDVHISNVTFDGTGHKVWQAFRHLGTGSFDNVGFQNIVFPTYSGTAIAAFGATGDVDVTNSVFSQIGRVGVLYFGAGQTGTFANNTYTGKGVGDWLDYALDISAGAVVDVEGNTITMNRGTASSDGSGSAAILVSTYFGAGTIANISGNMLDDNSMGVAIGYDGSDSSEVTMTGNTISNNDFGITLSSDDAAAASSANRNAIAGNGAGVDNDGAEVFDATCNWWGAASGPDGTYGGSGDSIVGPADELPWLVTDDLAGDCVGGFPVIDGIVDIELEDQDDPGEVVEYTPTATSPIDGDLAVTCDPVSGSTFFVGETEVECEATDSESNTTTATFTVKVVDGPPVIDPHDDVTVEATSSAGAVVTYTSPATSDAVDGPGTATCVPASGSTFVIGETTVECDATDSAGSDATQTTFTVTVVDTTPPVIEGIVDIEVDDPEGDGEVVEFDPTSSSVVDGDLAVTCDPVSGSTFFVGETEVECEATDAGGNTTTETFTVTVTLVAGPPSTARYEGSDRYATAAAISAADFPDPALVDTVFVAVGTDYPDGLAAAATAGGMGVPVLLLRTGSIPTATADELTRLDPTTIVIVGGTDVVSLAVETALGAYADTVLRLAGADRYQTAVEVSKWAFPGGAAEVFVAVGTNHPDAITGGAAAAAVGGPILLVPGGSLPNVVRDEIIRLGATQITVIGGASAVSPDVFVALAAITATQRLSGANRYETAVAVSTYAFPGTVDRIYMAVGTDFPDALVGAAAAGSHGSPVLLMQTNALPASVAAEILRLDPTEVIILGGTSAISAAMETYLFNLIQ